MSLPTLGTALAAALAAVALTGCIRPMSVPTVIGQPAHVDVARYRRIAVVGSYAPTQEVLNHDETVQRNANRSGIVDGVVGTFNEVLLSKGFSLVDRSDFDAVLKEQKFQADWGGDNTQRAADIGKAMNVPAIMLVRINRVSWTKAQQFMSTPDHPLLYAKVYVSMTAKLIDVEKAAIVWQATYTGEQNTEDADGYQGAVEICARGVANAFPAIDPNAAALPPPPPEK